jgi:multidrug transporter EmrE-like cation transporter
MLKPADPIVVVDPPSVASPSSQRAAGERPVGELVHQLIEDGKSYARAEFALVKTIASAKASAAVLPAALFGAAFICLLAAVTALAVGVVIALAKFIGPLLAGIAGMLIFSAIAGGLAWFALKRIKEI